MLTYRIIFGLIDLDMSDYFTLQSSMAAVLQPAETHINCALTIVVLMYENIFSERIIKVWNSLPPSIVSFESQSMFSKSLGNVNLDIHTKY